MWLFSENNMTKYSFHDDYSEGAHPRVLEALSQSNLVQQSGYGDDKYCEDARAAIRKLIGANDAKIYFTPGGTGANLVTLACYLRPTEAVITTEAGHIVGKEGGAAEATGHKIITETGVDGKLTAEHVQTAYDRSTQFVYQPVPKMVFISNTTEIGTIYTKSELASLAAVCKKLKMYLFMDGARLAHALTAPKNDLTLKDVYNYTDVFWLGGTKNGALLGEAIVIKDPVFGATFPYHMKQRGALLAKGRVLGIQFSALLKDDLYWELARRANKAAERLAESLTKCGYKFWAKMDSNQVFVIFPPALVKDLEKRYDFFVWDKTADGSFVVRLVTSWATEDTEVVKLCTLVEDWTKQSS